MAAIIITRNLQLSHCNVPQNTTEIHFLQLLLAIKFNNKAANIQLSP